MIMKHQAAPNLFSLSSYHFDLPDDLIAERPCSPRDASRLMIVDREKQSLSEICFRDLKDFLRKEDRLIFNNTKVIPARLHGKRENGAKAEIFLSREQPDGSWHVLARPGKKLRPGSKIVFSDSFSCEVVEALADGGKRVCFYHEGKTFEQALIQYGEIPLPPYIKRKSEKNFDQENYQTVFAEHAGAVAAPTAGLHFTQELLENLKRKSVYQTFITLHVGLGTFRPVQAEDIRDHQMHPEWFCISPNAADEINATKGRRIAVGTTSSRALESAWQDSKKIVPGEYDTNIFIYPGHQFKSIDALLTNFHLPGSSLLMLVSAFGGYELIQEAYKKAVAEKFRFFSYGDVMLII